MFIALADVARHSRKPVLDFVNRGADHRPICQQRRYGPLGWTGPVFQLRKDYPTTLPIDPKPWKAFDFKTQPNEYLQALLSYAREGNEAVDWQVQNNTIRKWFHAPGLLDPVQGREFIHGLRRADFAENGAGSRANAETEQLGGWVL